jgi:hypothetical protein
MSNRTKERGNLFAKNDCLTDQGFPKGSFFQKGNLCFELRKNEKWE